MLAVLTSLDFFFFFNFSYSHPYDFELEHFTPAPELLTSVDPVVPKRLSETPLKMIEKEEELNRMLEDLRKYKELAVDLEHHSYRTFLGITCLMQISTADTDYLVDTLTLRDKLWILNEVFTKSTIVKVKLFLHFLCVKVELSFTDANLIYNYVVCGVIKNLRTRT